MLKKKDSVFVEKKDGEGLFKQTLNIVGSEQRTGECVNNNCALIINITMFQSSMGVKTIFLLLLPLVSNICLTSTQLDGLCTACPSNHQLSFGFCLPNIPGCLTQISPHLCSACLAGYTLSNNFCSPPSSQSQPPSMAYYLQLFGRGPNYRYEYLNYNLKGKYTGQLWDKISNVSMLFELKTTYGYVYAITYTNPYSNGGKIYRAEGLVDYFNVITQYRFEEIHQSEVNDYSCLIWRLERKVVFENIPTLNNIVLNQVQKMSENDYRLFYIGAQGQIFVKDVQKTEDPASINLSFPSLTQLYYSINQNTVINYVFSLFPSFQIHLSYTINSYTIVSANGVDQLYYKFIFDSQIVVVVKIDGIKLVLFSYEEPDNVVELEVGQVGGYLPFGDMQDATYLEVYNHVLAKQPVLVTKTVQSVRYQLVAGVNFLLQFNNHPFSHDKYQVIVHKPLNGDPSITSMNKNGVDISNTILSNPVAMPGAFNYEADSTFREVYGYFREKVQFQISSLLPIASVQFVMGAAPPAIDYMVIFTHEEYAYLRYDPNNLTSRSSILNFVSFGGKVPISQFATRHICSDRATVLAFLGEANPSLFGINVVIRFEMDATGEGSFEVDLLTQYGIYFIRVYQKTILYFQKVQQVSQSTCGNLAASQFTQSNVISTINTFILENYSQVSGYGLSLVQGSITDLGVVSYRMLYALGQHRYEVKIVEELGTYMINSVTYAQGSGCKPTEVDQGGQCVSQCDFFHF